MIGRGEVAQLFIDRGATFTISMLLRMCQLFMQNFV